ncbi:hypothetical protein [Clostridium minihomine]|uniref:hypothetical protein n=1 Tax=Clostridium minihomine TaxID=2045012 RepID=UPI000C7858F2|nr:hypothetical protein [Clostridium minihomine]
MENNRGKTPLDYSVDEILAEAKGRLSQKTFETLAGDDTQRTPQPPQPPQRPEQPAVPQPEPEISDPVQPAPQEMPAQPATPGQNGEIRFEKRMPEEEYESMSNQPAEKRGLTGFFERRRRRKQEKICGCEFEEEGDIYYGLQLKAVDEYKKGYDDGALSEHGPTPAFQYLFDATPEEEVEKEISARFQPLKPDVRAPFHLITGDAQEGDRTSIREVPADKADVQGAETPLKTQKESAAKTVPLPKQKAVRQESKTVEFSLPEPSGVYTLKQTPLPFPKEPEEYADLEEAARMVREAQPEPEPLPVKEEKKKAKKKQRDSLPSPSLEQEPETEELPVAQVDQQEAVKGVSVQTETCGKPDGETCRTEEPEVEVPTRKPEQLPQADAQMKKEQDEEILREATQRKKEQIRELVKASQKYRPETLPVHVLEFDRLTLALSKAEEDYMPLPQEQEEQPKHRSRKKRQVGTTGIHSFRFTGEVEDDNEPGDEPGAGTEPEPENLDDYTAQEDAPSILHELNAENRALALRLSVTGMIGAVLLFWGFVNERVGMLPEFLRIEILPLAYLVVNLCLLSISIGFCWRAVFGGLRALFRLQANSDSGVAVAVVAAWIQGVLLLFYLPEVTSAQLHLYAVLAALGLFLNTAGKLSMVRRIRSNFKFLASPEQKMGVELFDDYNTALQLAKGCVMGEPIIAYQKKTDFFKNFLRNSYEPDPSEQASQSMAPLLFIGSLILCIVSLVLTRSAAAAITAFAAAACIGAPFTNMLCVNMPISRLCALARRCGTMLVGNPAVEYFCNTNAVMMDAKELFPKGTVILNGIKTFGGQRIDEALMDATAVMCTVGGPLSDLFEQIIQSRREILPKAENITYEDERGVTGWVGGRRTLVGNRHLLEQHGLTPPSRDYEKKYLLGGKKVVYLASQGELVAMFVISYNSDKRRALELRRMEENGISLVLRTTDPNITSEFVAECFGLDPHSVRILPETLGEVYQKQIEKPRERADALFVSKGRPAAMMRILSACVREKSNVTMATLLQTVGVVLGFVLVTFLVFYSGLSQLTTLALVLYQFFWAAAVFLIPRLRKP